jgi:hypothetical protein
MVSNPVFIDFENAIESKSFFEIPKENSEFLETSNLIIEQTEIEPNETILGNYITLDNNYCYPIYIFFWYFIGFSKNFENKCILLDETNQLSLIKYFELYISNNENHSNKEKILVGSKNYFIVFPFKEDIKKLEYEDFVKIKVFSE